MLANPKYGMVGFISYLYFLIYELLSPYIEILGTVAMALALGTGLLNISFMLLYLGIYVAYSSILSLAAFFARIHTIDLKLTLKDGLKAIGLCGVEVFFLRFILAWVRAKALLGSRKKQKTWGQIERKRINLT